MKKGMLGGNNFGITFSVKKKKIFINDFNKINYADRNKFYKVD